MIFVETILSPFVFNIAMGLEHLSLSVIFHPTSSIKHWLKVIFPFNLYIFRHYSSLQICDWQAKSAIVYWLRKFLAKVFTRNLWAEKVRDQSFLYQLLSRFKPLWTVITQNWQTHPDILNKQPAIGITPAQVRLIKSQTKSAYLHFLFVSLRIIPLLLSNFKQGFVHDFGRTFFLSICNSAWSGRELCGVRSASEQALLGCSLSSTGVWFISTGTPCANQTNLLAKTSMLFMAAILCGPLQSTKPMGGHCSDALCTHILGSLVDV